MKRNRILACAAMVVAAWFVSSLSAQETVSLAGMSVAVVDVQKVFNESAAGKKCRGEFEDFLAPLRAITKDVRGAMLMDGYAYKASKPEEREPYEKRIILLKRKLEDLDHEARRGLMKKEEEQAQAFDRLLLAAVKRHAENQQIDIVFTHDTADSGDPYTLSSFWTASTSRPLIHVDARNDITQAILKLVDREARDNSPQAAQEKAPRDNERFAGTKVVVLDVQKVLKNSEHAKRRRVERVELMESFKARSEPLKIELIMLGQARRVKPDQQAARIEKGLLLKRQLEALNEEARRALFKQEKEHDEELDRLILDAVKRYAAANEVRMVLDRGEAQPGWLLAYSYDELKRTFETRFRPVIYVDPSNDITQAILELVDRTANNGEK